MKYEKTKNYLHMNMRKKNRIMRQLSAAVFLSACLGLTGGCTEEEEYTQGQWWRRSDFDGYARMYASSFTIGNQGYMCCGYRGSNRDYLKDLWVYDTDGNYWTQLSDMPEEAQGRHSAAAFALDGKGYVTTGQIKNDPEYLADTWEYDPSTDTWTRMDDFAGGARGGALAFSLGGYGYVGTGYDDSYQKSFYRFDPHAASGQQWEVVNFSGQKRRYGTAFVIDNVAYVCCGENNGTILNEFWKFDGETWIQLRDIANTNDDEDYDDNYAIARYCTVSFVIDGKGYIATGNRSGVTDDYWMYNPEQDLWYGDSDDNFTPLSNVHNNSSGASSRYGAVSFSTGTRGFVLLGGSGGSSYFDDVYELLPYDEEKE